MGPTMGFMGMVGMGLGLPFRNHREPHVGKALWIQELAPV